MVALAERLEAVTPDADGLPPPHDVDRRTSWTCTRRGRPCSTRSRPPAATTSAVGRAPAASATAPVRRSCGPSASGASGTPPWSPALVAVLIRCSFYAEHTSSAMDKQPLVEGFALLLHRVFHGPIEGVNLDRTASPHRTQPDPGLPETTADTRPMRRRGEQTRQRLLDAGAAVLPRLRLPRHPGGRHRGGRRGQPRHLLPVLREQGRLLPGAGRDGERADARRSSTSLRIDASPEDLRTWLRIWFDSYEADGGVISTWQEMQCERRAGRVLPGGGRLGVHRASRGCSRSGTSATRPPTPSCSWP